MIDRQFLSLSFRTKLVTETYFFEVSFRNRHGDTEQFVDRRMVESDALATYAIATKNCHEVRRGSLK